MRSRWFMQRRKVLLPDPEGPRMQATLPYSTARSTPFRTCKCPNDFSTPRATTAKSCACLELELGAGISGIPRNLDRRFHYVVGSRQRSSAVAPSEMPLQEILPDR